MRTSTMLGILVASLAVAGCAGNEMVYSAGDPFAQIGDFYRSGAAGRDLKLEVRGNPFGVPDDAFARAVESYARQAALPREPTRPSLAPGQSANEYFQLVFQFDPPADLEAYILCQHPPRTNAVATPKGEVRALGAFCFAGKPLTEISGDTLATGPGDARFAQMVGDMMGALFRSDIPPHWMMPNRAPM